MKVLEAPDARSMVLEDLYLPAPSGLRFAVNLLIRQSWIKQLISR
jgi:hypothetical protein